MPEAKIDHDQIKTLTDLWVAAQRRQSVFVPGNRDGILGPKPAAFIMNLTGHQIMRMIERGLKVYRPAKSPYEKVTGRKWPAGKTIVPVCTCNPASENPNPKCKRHGGETLPW